MSTSAIYRQMEQPRSPSCETNDDRALQKKHSIDLRMGKQTSARFVLPMGDGCITKPSRRPHPATFHRGRTAGDSTGAVVFTPDGKAVAYPILENGVSNVFVQPLDGSPGRQITNVKSGTFRNFRPTESCWL
jgi:hypothetical protein